MTKQLRSIVTLTICSLAGVFALQVYFGYQVYQQHQLTLDRDANRALTEALVTADLARVDQISKLFARDIRNPELVSLSLNQEEEEPRIFVVNPQTGDIHVSIRFREEVDTSSIKEQLISELVRYNQNFLEEGSVMYWTEEIGERLLRYTDSIQVDKAVLLEEIRHELDSINIRSDFALLLRQDTTQKAESKRSSFAARETPITVDGFNDISIELKQVTREVLRRSGFVYLMTALLFLLIVISFLVLLRFVRRQKRLSQLKDDFIDNVSHELITPITTLKLALDTLDRQETGSNKYLSIGQQQAHRIAEVVDHILQVSFLDGQQAGLTLEPVCINNLITEVVDYYKTTTQQALNISTDFRQAYTVVADPKHLLNVLHNLVSNAIKYSDTDTISIHIKGIERSTTLQVSFMDNGPGIPPEDRAFIFDKFHRVNKGNTHEVKGLGIGLYYARNIMQQMAGQLWLSRSSPAGSVFTLEVPLTKPASNGE